ncbi:MAG: cell division topological specificity factor MinE [Nevskiales bacterium]
MDWKTLFGRQQKNSASLAKERLQVIVAHQRSNNTDHPDYFPQLQKDLLKVIRKYVQVNDDALRIEVERDQDMDLLELNITLPEQAAIAPQASAARKTPSTRASSGQGQRKPRSQRPTKAN